MYRSYNEGWVQKEADLSELKIPVDTNPINKGESLKDYSVFFDGGAIYFRYLEQELIGYIDEAEVVVGCVAWLTSELILKALAKKKGVSIIIQKEDFLRPDLTKRKNFTSWLHNLYYDLPTLDRHFGLDNTILGSMDTFCDGTVDAIRCVGNYNQARASAFPRAHHKFVLFCRNSVYQSCSKDIPITPYAVWTGSYNFTENAGKSFENAVVLRDEKVVNAYYQEYGQIAALSEPLDWRSEWCCPEWRIGT